MKNDQGIYRILSESVKNETFQSDFDNLIFLLKTPCVGSK